MAIHQSHLLDGLRVEPTALFLVPRIYRLLAYERVSGRATAGILVRHLIEQADAAEWRRVEDQVYDVLSDRHAEVDSGPSLDLEDINHADRDLAASCYARLCRDEFLRRPATDLKVLEVAALAICNDRARGTRQFRNFLHFLATTPDSPLPAPTLPKGGNAKVQLVHVV